MSLIQNSHRLLLVFIGACILFIILQLNSLQIQNSVYQPFNDNSSSRLIHFDSNTTNSSQSSTNVSPNRRFVVDVQKSKTQNITSSSSSSSPSSSFSSSPSKSYSVPPAGHSSISSHPPSSPSNSSFAAHLIAPIMSPLPSSHLQHSLKSTRLKNHNHNQSYNNIYRSIMKLPLYNGPKNVSRVLLLTYFRSGSSYLGDIMQQNWKTFYSYEPLIYLTLGYKINQTITQRGLDVVQKIFDCNFDTIDPEYLKHLQKNQFLVIWNKFLYSVCRNNALFCSTKKFLEETCKRSHYNLIKSTRLTMDHVEILWKNMKNKNFHVVFLIRDPRGIWNSRLSRDFCINSKGCTDIDNICTEMRNDLKKYDQLKNVLGDKLILFKYEDIASDVSSRNSVKELMKSVDFPYSSSVARFVKTHSNAPTSHDKINDPYSTFRVNSTSTANQWMIKLNKTQIIQAQEICVDILKRFNYTFMK